MSLTNKFIFRRLWNTGRGSWGTQASAPAEDGSSVRGRHYRSFCIEQLAPHLQRTIRKKASGGQAESRTTT